MKQESQNPVPRSIWLAADGWSVEIIDQTRLPHEFVVVRLRTVGDAARAIVTMQVRGAPLIGVTAAYGMALAMRADSSRANLGRAYTHLLKTRPTAINLRWALDQMRKLLTPLPQGQRGAASYAKAAELAEQDLALNHTLGEHGLKLLREMLKKKKRGEPLQIMTHCNAGRLATVGWGTVTAPIYLAQAKGLPVHVWVSETRPRNQGAALTAWELGERGVPLTVISDNAAGHLLQRGLVDLIIVGADRVTARGDVANKIGTYMKALAANANGVPFYVAFPESTVDWAIRDGVKEIPIEQRNAREVTHLTGALTQSKVGEVRLTPEGAAARNDAFDVTPANLVTGFITERGVCRPAGLKRLFGKKK
jgi:methylthioribose-1-phosphate isomerase